MVGPLLAVRLQMALHADAERVAEQFVESEAANDGRRLLRNGKVARPMQENPMLDILQVRVLCAHERAVTSLARLVGGLTFAFLAVPPLHVPCPQGAHERLYSRLFIS